MKREEQIKELTRNLHSQFEKTIGFGDVVRLSLQWADEHPVSGEQIAAMKNEIKFLKRKLAECDKMYRELQNKNPWVTDDVPEIKEDGYSDPVLLLVDGQFLKISRLCNRSDGSTYWIGVEDWNGEEVDAWMPIPETPIEKRLINGLRELNEHFKKGE